MKPAAAVITIAILGVLAWALFLAPTPAPNPEQEGTPSATQEASTDAGAAEPAEEARTDSGMEESGAGGAAAEETVTLTGTVACRMEGEEIKEVTFTAGTDVYQVDLDQKGRELAEQLSDRSARITGLVRESDGRKHLRIQEFEVAAEPSGHPAPSPSGS